MAPAAEKSLLLWGGTHPDGEPFLETAFVMDAPPAMPARGGAHEMVGSDERGGELFSFSFDMDEIADGDGSSSFAFAVPVSPHWAESLARITLTGPGGEAVIDRDGVSPAAVLRDPVTGRLRGILRDWPAEGLAGAEMLRHLPEAGLDVQVSRGVPSAEAWRR